MTTEPDVMPYDAPLLAKVIDEHKVTVKALAERSGRDETSIYRYLTGDRTIPSIVLRAAFELTLDKRIAALVTGTIPIIVIIEVTEARPPLRIPPIEQVVSDTSEATKSAVDAMHAISKILADGKIDQSDLPAIAAYQKFSAAVQRGFTLVDAALAAHVEKVGKSS